MTSRRKESNGVSPYATAAGLIARLAWCEQRVSAQVGCSLSSSDVSHQLWGPSRKMIAALDSQSKVSLDLNFKLD